MLALTGGLDLGTQQSTPYQAPTGPAPWDFTIDAWDTALGGDLELTSDSYTTLGAYSDPTLGQEVTAVRAVAEQTLLADVTGRGQDAVASLTPVGLAPYWPREAPTGVRPQAQCQQVDILAVSPAALPVEGPDTATLGLFDRYAKTLVAFTGICTEQTYDLTSPAVRYVYTGHGEDGWVPLRSWQVPSAEALDTAPGATEPYEWELTQVGAPCTATSVVRARIAVADALTQMCQAASDAGVELEVTAGYRTRAEQASVFQDAVRAYGSPEAARMHVAYADDDVCTSKHCSALAVNVEPRPQALAWLTQTVGCVAGDGTVTAGERCASDQTPVPNAARWGFSAPLQVSPGYLEFTVPLAGTRDSSLAAPNCKPTGLPVANQVAAIFRCRLAREGVVGPTQDAVVAEALTVSRCESGWNPSAAAFGGRFATTAHPTTGRTYSHRGVFMVTAELATDGWVIGGPDAVTDPAANINAAASLWLSTRSWEQFGCATGDPGGFQAGPVLPQFGGPTLPDWASVY